MSITDRSAPLASISPRRLNKSLPTLATICARGRSALRTSRAALSIFSPQSLAVTSIASSVLAPRFNCMSPIAPELASDAVNRFSFDPKAT